MSAERFVRQELPDWVKKEYGFQPCPSCGTALVAGDECCAPCDTFLTRYEGPPRINVGIAQRPGFAGAWIVLAAIATLAYAVVRIVYRLFA